MTTQDILLNNLTLLKNDIIARQKSNGQTASGRTESMYTVSAERNHGWLGGANWVGTLEEGRRPGKAPMYFEQIILRWIEAKGLQPRDGESVERMAAAIAWHIRKYGSFLHVYGLHVDLLETPLKEFTKRLSKDISAFYAQTIINEVFKK